MSNNPNIKLGWPYPARTRFLAELAQQVKGEYVHPLRFQGKINHFQVHKVEIDLPKYRLANGRTQAAQETHLAKHPELSSDFFTRDLEAEQPQEVQHNLLWQLVESSNLLDYFKDITHAQEQPLILSDLGFVVNGNRRLCAIRELFYGNPERYSQYSHIDVIILPHCTAKDIDELEAYLQIQPDIKQEYTWISKACMLRARQTTYKYTNEQLASLYGISEKEIRATLNQLMLVDEYLASRNQDKQYGLVEQDEFAFKQLIKAHQQLKQAEEKDLLKSVAFCLIESGSEVGGRLYERIPEIKNNLPTITERLTEELKPEPQSSQLDSVDDLFGDDTNGGDAYSALLEVISVPDNRAAVVETVIDVIESQKEKERKRVKVNAVLQEISNANSSLRNALNCINEDTVKTGIEEQLQNIEQSIMEIRSWLSGNA